MTLQVRTFTFLKLAMINGIGAIPIVASCATLAYYISSPIPLIFIPILTILLVFLGHKLSTKTSQITVDTEVIRIDDLTINRKSLSNFFLNHFGMGMVRLELLLENGTIHTIEYKLWGKNGRSFDLFFKELNRIKIENQKHLKKSEYLGMHLEQIKIMLPIIYTLMAVVILIDLWMLIMIISNTHFKPNYKILLINLSFLYFIPYMKILGKKN